MKNVRIRGRLSLVWLLALAVLLYTGVCLLNEAKRQKSQAAEVFVNGGVYEKSNVTIKDLLE